MSLVDVDSWVTEHDSCERLSHAIRTQIFERDRQKPLSDEYSKISANIRIFLRQFELELEQLKNKLSTVPQKKSITVEEIERRQRQIETLQSAFNELQNKFLVSSNISNAKSAAERNQLLGIKSSLWENDDDDDDDDEPIINNIGGTVQDFEKLKKTILENQDKGLESLSATISRQKELSRRLGQEITTQNVIIDNISGNMDDINYRVNRETRNIGTVNQRDNTCGYWVVIIILFIAILVLALLG